MSKKYITGCMLSLMIVMGLAATDSCCRRITGRGFRSGTCLERGK